MKSVLIWVCLFLALVTLSAEAQTSDFTEEAFKKAFESNLRSEPPFDLTGTWQLFVPKSEGVIRSEKAPIDYLSVAFISRLDLQKDNNAYIQNPGQKPKPATWHHASAGTYFAIALSGTNVVLQLNYFMGQRYLTQETYKDVWRSIKDAFEIGEIEGQLLFLTMDYMDGKVAWKTLKNGMDRLVPLRHRPNIVTFPVILSILRNGTQNTDSQYAAMTRHSIVKIGR